MAQEIVTWCDIHMRQDERVPGRTVNVSVEGPLMAVDLCEVCEKGYVQPLRELLGMDGRAVGEVPVSSSGRTKKSKDHESAMELVCPECAQNGTHWSSTYRSKLRGHCLRTHNEPLAAIESRFGISVEGKPLDHECIECGLKFAEPQGLGTHRVKAHGYTAADAAAERAEKLATLDIEEPEQAEPKKRPRKKAS